MYGSVFGMSRRTMEIDEEVVEILMNVDTSRGGLDILLGYLRTLSPIIAVKVALSGDWRSTLREFLVGREVAVVTYPLGIRAVPAVYTLFQIPWNRSGLLLYKRNANIDKNVAYLAASGVIPRVPPPDDEVKFLRREGSEALASNQRELHDELLSQYRNLTEEDTVMYQEYIEGSTFGDMIIDGEINIAEYNGILCYLHGLLSYLYARLHFVHNDLHYNNIMLRRGRATLPILSETGTVFAYIDLPVTPVLLDMGMAKTDLTVLPGVVTTYNGSPISDIISLIAPDAYERTEVIRRSDVVAYPLVREILLRNGDLDLDRVDRVSHPGPYMRYKSEGILTHEAITLHILQSGAIAHLLVNEPQSMGAFQNLSLQSLVQKNPADLLAKINLCLERYKGIVANLEGRRIDTNPIFERAVILYLESAVQFYSRT